MENNDKLIKELQSWYQVLLSQGHDATYTVGEAIAALSRPVPEKFDVLGHMREGGEVLHVPSETIIFFDKDSMIIDTRSVIKNRLSRSLGSIIFDINNLKPYYAVPEPELEDVPDMKWAGTIGILSGEFCEDQAAAIADAIKFYMNSETDD